MLSKKTLRTLDMVKRSALAALPVVPFLGRRRRSSIMMPLVMSGIGVALASGIAAIAFFSPRTRYRALDIAKNTYGKVNSRITHLRSKTGEGHHPLANGLSTEAGVSGYSSTGL
jgi:hypothetical protein